MILILGEIEFNGASIKTQMIEHIIQLFTNVALESIEKMMDNSLLEQQKLDFFMYIGTVRIKNNCHKRVQSIDGICIAKYKTNAYDISYFDI